MKPLTVVPHHGNRVLKQGTLQEIFRQAGIPKPLLVPDFNRDVVGGVTNGVKFIWNAAADLPAGFKAQGVRVKVTAKK